MGGGPPCLATEEGQGAGVGPGLGQQGKARRFYPCASGMKEGKCRHLGEYHGDDVEGGDPGGCGGGGEAHQSGESDADDVDGAVHVLRHEAKGPGGQGIDHEQGPGEIRQRGAGLGQAPSGGQLRPRADTKGHRHDDGDLAEHADVLPCHGHEHQGRHHHQQRAETQEELLAAVMAPGPSRRAPSRSSGIATRARLGRERRLPRRR